MYRVKIALDPYMFRTTPLLELPGAGRGARLRVHRALAARGLHPVLQAPAGGRGHDQGVPEGAQGGGRRGLLAAAAVPLVGSRRGRARGGRPVLEAVDRDRRRAGRDRDELRVQRPAGAGRACPRRCSGGRWRSCCRSSSARGSSSASSRIPTTSWRTAVAASTWCAASTRRTSRSCTARRTRSTMGGDVAGIMEHAGDLVTHVHVADSLRPSGVVGPALHHSTRRARPPGPPAPGHRPGRGRLGRVLRDPRRAALRRHHDRVRVRVGGTGPGVQPRQPRGDPAPDGVVDPSRLSRRRRP